MDESTQDSKRTSTDQSGQFEMKLANGSVLTSSGKTESRIFRLNGERIPFRICLTDSIKASYNNFQQRESFGCRFITARHKVPASALGVIMKKSRARDLGVPFEGITGSNNAITDVEGLMVGYTTLIEGEDVRIGVSAILPKGHDGLYTRVPGAIFSLNGNGEMTGYHWVEEAGMVDGPIMLTNTHSVGLVRDATIAYLHNHPANPRAANEFFLPVASETYDGVLNDMNGHHVTAANSRP